LISLLTSFFGVYLSFYLDSAPAPTIIMLLSITFILVFIYSSYQAKVTASKYLHSDVAGELSCL